MKGNVCLTFDFDASSLWIQRDMTSTTAISRGEFGVNSIERILTFLKSRGIKATFYIPGHTMESYPEQCIQIMKDGHEIGLHGYMHENFNTLSQNEEKEILLRTNDILKEMSGAYALGFRSPSWDITNRTMENLEQMGVIYDSSQMALDYSPYFCRIGDEVFKDKPIKFGRKSNLIEIPISWSLDDYPYFEFLKTPTGVIQGLQNEELVYDNWRKDVDYMLRDFKNGVLVATFHPQVSGRGHRFLGFEKWVDYLIDQGIDFKMMKDVANEFNNGVKFGEYSPIYND